VIDLDEADDEPEAGAVAPGAEFYHSKRWQLASGEVASVIASRPWPTAAGEFVLTMRTDSGRVLEQYTQQGTVPACEPVEADDEGDGSGVVQLDERGFPLPTAGNVATDELPTTAEYRAVISGEKCDKPGCTVCGGSSEPVRVAPPGRVWDGTITRELAGDAGLVPVHFESTPPRRSWLRRLLGW
jgi:hypothetical protein